MQFRSDVKKQAKRIMQSQDYSAMRASSSAALMTTSSHTHNGYIRPSGDLGSGWFGLAFNHGYWCSLFVVSRIRELEEENRQLKLQNEKQQALMNKYRERWEKLKESAKKRRAQPEQVRTCFRLWQWLYADLTHWHLHRNPHLPAVLIRHVPRIIWSSQHY